MSRPRRFRIESLAGRRPGDCVALSPEESRHARVLRLQPGARLELFDDAGRRATALLQAGGGSSAQALIEELSAGTPADATAWRMTLATAWPKGKRAAVLVEKCSELGVQRIVPVRCARSVVSKGEDAQGLARLRRIAAEAAKQCGRGDVPEIAAEMDLRELFALKAPAGSGERSGSGWWGGGPCPPESLALVFDPAATMQAADALTAALDGEGNQEPPGRSLLLLIGPEGGLTEEELIFAGSRGALRVRLARHVLRVETAAIAACALAGALFRA